MTPSIDGPWFGYCIALIFVVHRETIMAFVLAGAKLWFGLGFVVCLIGMMLGIWEAYALAAVFGGIVSVIGRLLKHA